MAPKRDRGQATVEFAMVLPLIALVAIGMFEVMFVVRDQLHLELATREAARAAAVAADPGAAAHRAARQVLGHRPVEVTVSSDSTTVTVGLRMPVRFRLPVMAPFGRHLELRATATMAWDPPEP